jgi:4-oxalocrotonate tautomerase
MPYVNVRIAGSATPEQKDEVIKGITDVLVRVLDKNPETTFVVIDEVALENWGHRSTSVATARRRAET